GLQTRGRGRVAEAGRVLDVRRAEEAGDLLGDVVDLVRDSPRRQVEGEARRVGRPDARGDLVERLVPRDPGEAALALPAAERVGEPPERTKLSARLSCQ